MEGCDLQEAEAANIDRTRSEWQKWRNQDYLKLEFILMIYARGFGLCLLSEVISYRLLSFGACWLSIVQS